jgi:hypothetical protein
MSTMITRRHSVLLSRAAALLLAALSGVLVAACADEDADNTLSPSGRGGAGCRTVEQVFEADVYRTVIVPRCSGCHNPTGFAAKSALVFKRSDEPNAARDNLDAIRRLSADSNGQPYLLRKSRGEENHGGGAQLAEGSAEYVSLESLVAVASQDPSSCVP